MEIPHTLLSPEALRALVVDFVTRDGTDYGASETPLESKVAQVLRALERGEAVITYDEASSSCGIAPRESRGGA
jgi:hypothetical protein